MRRMLSRMRDKSAMPWPSSARQRSSSGSTSSLLTMIDTAMLSTITMPVAADRPPTNTNRASHWCPAASGRDSTKLSGFVSCPAKYISPPNAMGSTKMLMASR